MGVILTSDYHYINLVFQEGKDDVNLIFKRHHWLVQHLRNVLPMPVKSYIHHYVDGFATLCPIKYKM